MGKGLIIFFFLLALKPAFAQTDSIPALPSKPEKVHHPASYYFRDSASLARYLAKKDSIKHVKDSLKILGDSLSMAWIKRPDPNRPDQFLDSLLEVYTVKNLDFKAWAKQFPAKDTRYSEGHPKPKGETWILGFIVFLLLLFAILRNSFSKELDLIVQSLYSNRIFNQISREESLFRSWPFVVLYIILGFTIGTFLYLCTQSYQFNYYFSGFQGLAMLSLIIIGLFTLKIITLKLLGFLFNLERIVRSYISVLYISYFNVAILFLPIVIAFSLTPFRFHQLYIFVAIGLVAAMFLVQVLRAATMILSEYRFPIVYLVLYICALEISPLLILFKALRF